MHEEKKSQRISQRVKLKLPLISLAVLILIGSISLCQGQSLSGFKCDAALGCKKLSDGSYEIVVDGQRLKAVTNAQLNEQAKAIDLMRETLSAQLAACQKDRNEADLQNVKKDHEIELLKKDVTIAEMKESEALAKFERSKQDTAKAQEDAKRNFGLLMGERQLRINESQFIPHGNVGGLGGELLKVLDGPVGQIAFKLVIPAAQFGKTYFGRCQ